MNQNETNKRDSMVFYRTFYEPLLNIPPESRYNAIAAIIEYGLDGKTPENLDNYGRLAFEMAYPLIDVAKKRYNTCVINGRKGGRPKKKNQSGFEGNIQSGFDEKNLNALKNENLNDNDNDYDYAKVNENTNEKEHINISVNESENEGTKKEPDTAGSDTLPVGEYQNVFLSATERAKLIIELGYDGYEKSVDCLSRYIKRKPEFHSACHFEDLRSWVQDRLRKEGVFENSEAEEKRRKAIQAGFDIEFEDIFEKP